MTYKLLDLYCGGGGAGAGYARAGFEVTGVDIVHQKRYPFRFFQADALEFLAEHGHEYDVIHASPPCQGYSHLTPDHAKSAHPKMIEDTRCLLIKTGKPYVIENVAGARSRLIDPIMLCGTMFGLKTWRHRYFESNIDITANLQCDHSIMPLLVTTASKASREKRFAMGLKPKSVFNAKDAYGIDWMTGKELAETIPPAYTFHIGTQLWRHLNDTR